MNESEHDSAPNACGSLILHDLVNGQGDPLSPYCWRVREALYLLGLEFETDALLFTDIPARFDGHQETLPVLTTDQGVIADSWRIVCWLDANASPSNAHALFGSPEGAEYSRFFTEWSTSQVAGLAWRCLVKDIHDSLHVDDQPYFRKSREKRLGGFRLEATLAVRDTYRDRFRRFLEPARRMVADGGFISGNAVGYPDVVLHSLFQWARTSSEYELLEGVDPLVGWLARMDVWLESARTD